MNTLSRLNSGTPTTPARHSSKVIRPSCAIILAALLSIPLARSPAQDTPQPPPPAPQQEAQPKESSVPSDSPAPAPAGSDSPVPPASESPAPAASDSSVPAPQGAELETPDLAPAEPPPPPPPPSQQVLPGSASIDYSDPLPSEELPDEPTETLVTPATIRADYQEAEMTRTFEQRTTLLDGVGGLGSPLSSPINRPVFGPGKGITLGPVSIKINIGAGVLGGKGQSSGGGNGSDVGVSGFGSINILATLDQPAFDRTATLTYGFTGTGGSYNQTNGPINQALSFTASQKFSRAQINVDLAYAGLSGTDRDTGTDTGRDFITAGFGLSYEIGAKTSLSSSVSAPIRTVEGGLDSGGVTMSNFINYTFSPKLTVGPGFAFGFEKVQDSDIQTFERPLLSLNYIPSPFIGINGNVGYEFRQIQGSTFTSPIFGLGVTWTPRLGTVFSISGNRSTQTSLTEVNTNYEQTSLSISARQNIGKRVVLSAGFNYENAVYESVGTDGESGRIDNLVEGEIGISYSITSQWRASLSLSMGKNFSNERPIDYQQATFQTTYSF